MHNIRFVKVENNSEIKFVPGMLMLLLLLLLFLVVVMVLVTTTKT